MSETDDRRRGQRESSAARPRPRAGPLPSSTRPSPPPSAKPGVPQPTPTGEILPIDHPLSASSKRLVPTPRPLGARRPGASVIAPLAPPPAASAPARPRRAPARSPVHRPGPRPRAGPPGAPVRAPRRPPPPLPRAGRRLGPAGRARARPRRSPLPPSSDPGRALRVRGACPAHRSPGHRSGRPACRRIRPARHRLAGRLPARPGAPVPPPLPPMTETSLGIPVMPLETEAAPLPVAGHQHRPAHAPVDPGPAAGRPGRPGGPGGLEGRAARPLDYFELLGIATDASAAAVKRAFYTREPRLPPRPLLPPHRRGVQGPRARRLQARHRGLLRAP